MLRNKILGSVGLLAAAVMLFAMPDNASARHRRCGCSGYGRSAGAWGGGWGNGYSSNSGFYNNGGYAMNSVSYGTNTSASCCSSSGTTSTTTTAMPSGTAPQSYSTGYPPQAAYDANGNLINNNVNGNPNSVNGNNVNSQAPAPNTINNQNTDRGTTGPAITNDKVPAPAPAPAPNNQ